MTTHYFPDADVPALQPFTQAFVRMMFAHAAFERRVSDQMNVITGTVGFGEQPDARWSADQRPRRMKKLINKYRPNGLPETADIVNCLKRSISFFRERAADSFGNRRWDQTFGLHVFDPSGVNARLAALVDAARFGVGNPFLVGAAGATAVV
jgi:hypothetical protein